MSTTIGLDAGRISADDIHLYHDTAALLVESMEVIRRTSALILSAIETPAVVAEETDTGLAEASLLSSAFSSWVGEESFRRGAQPYRERLRAGIGMA